MNRTPPLSILVAGALLPLPSLAQSPKPPAQYWMSIATENVSIPGMAEAGEGVEGMLAGMMIRNMSTGGKPRKTLWLDLLGPDTPAHPHADHLIPPGMNMGPSLPLTTRPPGNTGESDDSPQREDMRLLLFWGCGEAIRPGQPRVLDTAKLGTEDYSAVLVARGSGSRYRLSPRKGWTYGEWPDERLRTMVPANASIQGEHVIRGNYSPEIKFQLTQRQEFMAPVNFTKVQGGMQDAIKLEWQAIPNATGYFMMATGANEKRREIIIWTSSDVQEMGGGLLNFQAPAAVQKYIQQKVVMKPDITRCTIPKGIFKNAEGGAVQFITYGDETNFAHPPKPADPKAKWHPIWTAKVRVKSTSMLPLGMEAEGPAAAQVEKEPPTKADKVKDAVDGINTIRGLFGF